MGVPKQRFIKDIEFMKHSSMTMRTYLGSITDFVRHYKRSPQELTQEDIKVYLTQLLKNKASWSTINVVQRTMFKVLGRYCPDLIKRKEICS